MVFRSEKLYEVDDEEFLTYCKNNNLCYGIPSINEKDYKDNPAQCVENEIKWFTNDRIQSLISYLEKINKNTYGTFKVYNDKDIKE